MLRNGRRARVMFVCSRALCDRVAYDDGSVPVGDLGVVVERSLADCLFAGLTKRSAMTLMLRSEGTHIAGDLLELVGGKR